MTRCTRVALALLVAGLLPAMAGTGRAAPASPALALAALDRKMADLDAEEIASKKEIAGLGPRIKVAHDRALARGRAFYKLTRAGLLPVGGGFDSLVSHAMRVERARRSLKDDLDEERDLRRHSAEIARDLERGARDRDALARQRTSMDAARLAMDDEIRRQAAFEKAFESPGGATDYVAVAGDPQRRDMAEPSVLTGFAALRGRLLFPVAGRAEVRPAHREGADGPGIEVSAKAGTPVRAVFAGRVAFADRYGAYGRIVILDHGEHYYTVSGNLGAIDVKVGDEISAGERVGTVGDDGQGAVLYFELRHGTQTIAPGPWLGL